MKSSTVRLQPLGIGDIADCAHVHRQAFPGFFLSTLGDRFLKEFYRGFLEERGAIAIVARDLETGAVVGSVVGHIEPAGFFRRLLSRRWWAFALASLHLLLRRPGAMVRLLRAVTYRGDVPIDVTGALLSSVSVAPAFQRTGLGRRLVLEWLAEAAHAGASGAYLTTDAVDNEQTLRFYRQLGWRVAGDFVTPQGRRMYCLTRAIVEEAL